MTGALVHIEEVSVDFSGLRALNRVAFDVPEGGITGVIGPNGAGKTTLFNVITGDHAPSRGRVVFDGRDMTGLPPDRVCRMGISRTYQNVRPFLGLSVVDNIRVALLYGRRGGRLAKDEAEGEISALLDFVSLTSMAARRAGDLVPLNRKRLEIARALATNPRLLLFDEVIAGLTPTEAVEMMDTIRAINRRGVTVLLIEHVIKAVMGLSDKIVVLHHGEKIAEGDPAAITNDPTVIAAYLGSTP